MTIKEIADQYDLLIRIVSDLAFFKDVDWEQDEHIKALRELRAACEENGKSVGRLLYDSCVETDRAMAGRDGVMGDRRRRAIRAWESLTDGIEGSKPRCEAEEPGGNAVCLLPLGHLYAHNWSRDELG